MNVCIPNGELIERMLTRLRCASLRAARFGAAVMTRGATWMALGSMLVVAARQCDPTCYGFITVNMPS